MTLVYEVTFRKGIIRTKRTFKDKWLKNDFLKNEAKEISDVEEVVVCNS